MERDQTRRLCSPHCLQPSRGLFLLHYVISLTATTSTTTATTTTANSDSDSGSGKRIDPRVKFVTAAEAKSNKQLKHKIHHGDNLNMTTNKQI